MKPIIFGATGLRLTAEEVSFFGEHKPCGFILFRRNVDTPEQVKALVEASVIVIAISISTSVKPSSGAAPPEAWRRRSRPRWRSYRSPS